MAIEIEKLNTKFEGEFRFRGKKRGIPFTLPGDQVSFDVKRAGRGVKLQVTEIHPAPSYDHLDFTLQEPGCELFTRCGGCRARHILYDDQLRIKSAGVIQKMKDNFLITPDLKPAPRISAYRNRMDFVVEENIVGLRSVGDFSTFNDIKFCDIQKDKANRALKLVREILAEHPQVPFRRKDFTGTLKYVTIRDGYESGAIILTVMKENIESQPYTNFINELTNTLRNLQSNELKGYSLVETYSENHEAEVSCTPGGRAILGSPGFQEKMGGNIFDVPYDSFFQPNPEAFDILLDWSLEQLSPHRDQLGNLLMDLYSGAGVLSSIITARFPEQFNEVLGFDFVASSVERAKDHFPDPDMNIQFFAQDLNRVKEEIFPENRKGFLIADPPRAGISPSLRKAIRKSDFAPVFLYISCNPDSQVEDLKEITKSYRIEKAMIMDQFPHTPHLEQAVLLVKKEDGTIPPEGD